ncbi:Cullin repeat-like-containing domain protein [Catenaria anguillulae PL171]|uniref:Exocyst complex protein EXO70 n=1 Tax=Catenaria anguillulae PL171 TaxID=765915 RepID=A0A1Y2HT70_9FUNG|nr:Cullin repeat-like-containing domain protein [Catenaria anguillulae PL171]
MSASASAAPIRPTRGAASDAAADRRRENERKLMEDMADLEVLQDTLVKSHQFSSQMIDMLNSFDDRLKSFEQAILPIHRSTRRLNQYYENLDRTLVAANRVILYYDLADVERATISNGPDEANICRIWKVSCNSFPCTRSGSRRSRLHTTSWTCHVRRWPHRPPPRHPSVPDHQPRSPSLTYPRHLRPTSNASRNWPPGLPTHRPQRPKTPQYPMWPTSPPSTRARASRPKPRPRLSSWPLGLPCFSMLALALLESTIEAKARTYKKPPLAVVFQANNTHYILKNVRAGKLLPLLGPDCVAKYEKVLKRNRDAFQDQLKPLIELLMDVTVIQGGAIRKDMSASERTGVKDKFSKFNTALEDAIKSFKGCAVADPELRGVLIKDAKALVVPMYERFVNKYQASEFSKHKDKYIKYEVAQVGQMLERMFMNS